MKKYLLFAFFTFFALLFQRIWMEYFSLFYTGPDIILLLLVYFAIFHDPLKGVILAFVIGFIMDVLVGYHSGIYATTYIIIYFGTHSFGKNFYLRSVVFQIAAAALVTVSFIGIELLLLSAFEVPWEVRKALLWSLPGRLVLNVLVSPVVFKILWIIEDISTPSLLRQDSGYGFI